MTDTPHSAAGMAEIASDVVGAVHAVVSGFARLHERLSPVQQTTSPHAWQERYARFLQSWPAVRPAQSVVAPPAEPSPAEHLPFDAGRFATMMATLAPPLAHLRAQGGLVNPWRLAGLKRNEVRNAAALAGLWSPAQAGTLASDFLRAFLTRLATAEGSHLPGEAELRAGYTVNVEQCPLGLASERVDLMIEGRSFLIGVEVKIDAPEGRRQLERYVEAIHRRAADRQLEPAIILLAPFSRKLAGVTCARWRDVAAAARATATGRAQPASALLRRFADHIDDL